MFKVIGAALKFFFIRLWMWMPLLFTIGYLLFCLFTERSPVEDPGLVVWIATTAVLIVVALTLAVTLRPGRIIRRRQEERHERQRVRQERDEPLPSRRARRNDYREDDYYEDDDYYYRRKRRAKKPSLTAPIEERHCPRYCEEEYCTKCARGQHLSQPQQAVVYPQPVMQQPPVVTMSAAADTSATSSTQQTSIYATEPHPQPQQQEQQYNYFNNYNSNQTREDNLNNIPKGFSTYGTRRPASFDEPPPPRERRPLFGKRKPSPEIVGEKPLIFATRKDPSIIIMEYSDRLLFFKKCPKGGEPTFLAEELKG